MIFDKNEVNRSDALIIHHRILKGPFPRIARPTGQIWIMIQYEVTLTYGKKYSSNLQVKVMSLSEFFD